MAEKINFEGKIIKNRWNIQKRIGRGQHNNIYMGIDKKKQQVIAIKIVESSSSNILQHEANVLNIICPENRKVLGFPQFHWLGQDTVYNKYHFMISQMLGPSLQNLFQACNNKFSLKTVLFIAIGCLSQIESLHKQNYVHCNIKPNNFLMGLGDCSHIIYLTDFSISQLYRDFNTNSLIQYKVEENFKGSLEFMSLSCHYKICHGRKDDLESLGYMLIYFLKGRLPWNKEEYIKKKKLNTIFEEFCQDLPSEFIIYLNYCKDLTYYEEPDYDFLKSLFKDLLLKNEYEFDFEYDWVDISNINQQKVQELTIPLQFKNDNLESKQSFEEEFIENDAYFKQDTQKQNLNQRKKFSVFKKPMSSMDLEYQSVKEFDVDSNTQTYTDSNNDLLNSQSEFDREVTLIADQTINEKEKISVKKSKKKIIQFVSVIFYQQILKKFTQINTRQNQLFQYITILRDNYSINFNWIERPVQSTACTNIFIKKIFNKFKKKKLQKKTEITFSQLKKIIFEMNKRIQADFENTSYSTNQCLNYEYGDLEVSFHKGFSNSAFYNFTKFPNLTQTQIALQISKYLKDTIKDKQEKPSKKTIFNAKNIPKIDVMSYIQRIVKYSRISNETLLLAKIYVQRICDFSMECSLSFSNVHKQFKKIIFCSSCNCQLSNKDFCKIGGIKEQELLILEMEFLKIIKFQLQVSGNEFLEEVRKSFN